MILEGILTGVASEALKELIHVLFGSLDKRDKRSLDKQEIERIVAEYLATHQGAAASISSSRLEIFVTDYLGKTQQQLSQPLSLQLPAAPSPLGTTGWVQRFTGAGNDSPIGEDHRTGAFGACIYRSKHGAYPVWGAIGRCFEHLGGTTSRLGFPTSPELPAVPSQRGTPGQVQRFEGNGDGVNLWDEPNKVHIGVSIYSSRHGTYPTWGEIGRCYERLNGTTSRLGFPTSAELPATPSPQGTGGQVQRFEGGLDDANGVSIYCSPYGAYPTWGEIARRYEAIGGTGSHLGFPVTAEQEVNPSEQGGTKWIQRFESEEIRV